MSQKPDSKIEPYLMAVLSSRLTAIIREMTNTVLKVSRSAVIKNSRDFSCGLLTYDHRLLCVEDGLPIHLSALDLTTKPITELFDDIAEGDAYLNNCPYTGGTHHADLTICVPVMCHGEPLFWTLSRAHHADIGAPIPSTYLPEAATIYEEGLHFPCVRIQQDYRDRDDIVRMCRIKIRCSDIWYGDYQAQIGACRVGEKRLKELVATYGRQTIKDFIEEWMAYGERCAIAEIKKLPAGTWSYETAHDPVPGVADDGIPVKVSITIDPDAGRIVVDATDNMDCIPGGLNVSEACATASCLIGVFYNLDANIPHNDGSASRVEVRLRDGCVVGRPKYPVGTSVATTNVNSRLMTAVACCFAQIGAPYGLGEFPNSQALGEAVISGIDMRKGERPYVNQIFIGYGGGPAHHGYDGWLTSGAACDGGQMALDSIEINEAMYPILVESRGVAENTLGHGQWDGAPGMTGVYRPLTGELTAIYGSDGDLNAAKGVLGGHAAACSSNWKRVSDGGLRQLPPFHTELCRSDEALRFVSCGGGGYGGPTKREPERVAAAVNRRWISREKAESVYRVALRLAGNGVDYLVDTQETARLRGG